MTGTRAVSWVAMTMRVFTEDHVLDILEECEPTDLDLRAVMADAERLGYCERMETIGGLRHQYGAHPSRVWRSRLWNDTPQHIG